MFLLQTEPSHHHVPGQAAKPRGDQGQESPEKGKGPATAPTAAVTPHSVPTQTRTGQV